MGSRAWIVRRGMLIGENMYKLCMISSVVAVFFVIPYLGRAEGNSHRLGAGIHYWTVVDEVDFEGVDEDGLGWFASYQFYPSPFFGVQFDLEVLPNDFAGARDTVLAPQVYAVIGDTLYAALGLGLYYSDNNFSEDPFFSLRAGINMEFFPAFFLDVSGNYRITEWDTSLTEGIDTDTVTIAVAARIEL